MKKTKEPSNFEQEFNNIPTKIPAKLYPVKWLGFMDHVNTIKKETMNWEFPYRKTKTIQNIEQKLIKKSCFKKYEYSNTEAQNLKENYSQTTLRHMKKASFIFRYEKEKYPEDKKAIFYLFKQMKHLDEVVLNIILRPELLSVKLAPYDTRLQVDAVKKSLTKFISGLLYVSNLTKLTVILENPVSININDILEALINPFIDEQGRLRRLTTQLIDFSIFIERFIVEFRFYSYIRKLSGIAKIINKFNAIAGKDTMKLRSLNLTPGSLSRITFSVLDLITDKGNEVLFKHLKSIETICGSDSCGCSVEDFHLLKEFVPKDVRDQSMWQLMRDTGLKALINQAKSKTEFWELNEEKTKGNRCRGVKTEGNDHVDNLLKKATQFNNLRNLQIEFRAKNCYYSTSAYFTNLAEIAKNCPHLINLKYSIHNQNMQREEKDIVYAHDVIVDYFNDAMDCIMQANWKLYKLQLSFANAIECFYPEDMSRIHLFLKTQEKLEFLYMSLPPYIEKEDGFAVLRDICFTVSRLPEIDIWVISQNCIIDDKADVMKSIKNTRTPSEEVYKPFDPKTKYQLSEYCTCRECRRISNANNEWKRKPYDFVQIPRFNNFEKFEKRFHNTKKHKAQFDFRLLMTTSIREPDVIFMNLQLYIPVKPEDKKFTYLLTYIERYFNKKKSNGHFEYNIYHVYNHTTKHILLLKKTKFDSKICCEVQAEEFFTA